MAVNKYSKTLIKLNGGKVIERSDVVFVPKIYGDTFSTNDGTTYTRVNGTNKKVEPQLKAVE